MSSLIAASTLTHRARCARVTPLVSPSSVGAVLNLHQQQTRNLRFGRLWAIHVDADHHRDICRRHRSTRHRYAEILHRHLSWDKSSFNKSSKPHSKYSPYDYWRTEQWACAARNRWASSNIAHNTLENPTGIRPGQNIEDAERAPLEHLLFGKNERHTKRTIVRPVGPTKTFKSYRSQFSALRPPALGSAREPIFYDGPPPEAELKLYGNVNIDSEPWAAIPSKLPPAHSTSSVPDVVDALNNTHAQVLWNESNIQGTGSSEAQETSFYNDLDKYKPVADPSDQVEVDAEEYKDLGKYVPVKHQEPDGKPTHKDEPVGYEDLDKYGPVHSYEPHGKYKVDPEPAPGPEELEKYEDGVRSHEPDGKYKPSQLGSVSTEDMVKYSAAVRAHEPDGRYAPVYAEPNLDPAEIAEYSKPFLSHEPDGKYAEAYVQPPQDEAELAQYEAFRSHEPDGKYAANQPETGYDPTELNTYVAFRSHEPNGKYAASNTKPAPTNPTELKSYKPFRSHEPDGKYAAAQPESAQGLAELDSYQAVRSSEPDGKYAAASNAAPTELSYLDQYSGAFRSHEPNGQYAPSAESLAEDTDSGNHEGFTLEDSETSRPSCGREAMPGVKDEAEMTTEFRKIVKELMANPPADSTIAQQRSSSSSNQSSDGKETPKPKQSKRLTGQYVKDFPEDFAVSWSTEPSVANSSLLPTDLSPSSGRGTYTSGQEKITGTCQNSLGRQQPAPEHSRAETSPSTLPEPVLYKILVYDPVMQAIDVAETMSVVPDSATPLNPAEVLLRISNPARFFPHFAPLQAQGFEIVSGSGDVLIFRKVRDAAPSEKPQVASAQTVAAPSPTAPVNPIDMTGGSRLPEYNVAAGRFASPTGFVNYDLPPERTVNGYVPQGETFFSPGHRAEEMHERHSAREAKETKNKKKKSLPKRLAIGAAGVAGISFGVGALAEGIKNEGKRVKVVKKN
ncbi:hypothetical protein B0T21DRAFT_371786 [Apiosordaria backusii]|uniref:Uncharacterized protein n=1 Tax=Apiosordaria backusii TaxID=314023 RepID=A0AA40E769_9PEZI|nr:hypothetical protein B0T21DRAFT_371786 [Apiosordaria backusii]